jgi:hypothetical protein
MFKGLYIHGEKGIEPRKDVSPMAQNVRGSMRASAH